MGPVGPVPNAEKPSGKRTSRTRRHTGPERLVVALLRMLGEDPRREGLRETPRRVLAAWAERTSGYAQDPEHLLSTDFDSDGYDEMIVCRNIRFYSTCEHHLLPFVGLATVGYVPRHRIVGLSKLARLVECYARRLQVQERMTSQIANTMQSVLDPLGVGVVVRAQHLCMACRGVMKPEADMVTCSLTGVFREAVVRAEFMAHARGEGGSE